MREDEAHAHAVLRELGVELRPGDDLGLPAQAPAPHARWAASGLMALTGRDDGPPLPVDAPVADRLAGLAGVVGLLSERTGRRVDVDGPALAAERAGIRGLGRRGATSPGGTCRLLRAADGSVAVNLARRTDWELVPAWLDADAGDWDAVARLVEQRSVTALVERAALLGLPAATPASARAGGAVPLTRRPAATADGSGTNRGSIEGALVVDLTSLWAGPLCAHLLGRAGAEVVKVESRQRPDGSRHGSAAFFDLLHEGHRSVALDFGTADGVAALQALLRAADVVLEASRPRALEQLGIDREEVTAERGSVWVAITGWGLEGPHRNRPAFGDDAAAAGGLLAADEQGPVFCGDALADPVTGLTAAAGALAAVAAGGGWVVDVALTRAAAAVAAPSSTTMAPTAPPQIQRRGDGWEVLTESGPVPVAKPAGRRASGPAAPLGRDTDAVLAEVGVRGR